MGRLPVRLRVSSGDELAEVFDALVEEARRSGGPVAAHRRAARECADVARLTVASRLGRRRGDWGGGVGGLAGDVSLAARALRRRPGFTLAAAGTLAVGIGGATAVFAVADTLLLRPLPYPEGDRLVMVWRQVERFAMRRAPISLPDFTDWRAGARSFRGMAAYASARPTLLGAGDPARLRGYRVTGDLFGTLGVGVALGRPLRPDDDRPGAEPVAVLSHALWSGRFGGDPGVVGRALELDGGTVRVVGVARPGFDFPGRGDVWLPLARDPADAERDMNFLTPVARLADGVSLVTAQAEMRAVQDRVRAAHPSGNEVDDVWLEPRRAYEAGDGRPAVALLVGAVGLLLSIACANLTALLLVRMSGRRRELAVRSALGAGSVRIARALLAEGAVLAGLGGALGAGLAAALLRALAAVAPPELLRRGVPPLDARVLAFCLAAAAACALACALLPVRLQNRRGPGRALREGGAGAGRAGGRLRDGLVVAQVALATVLLVGAGLLGGSLARLLDQPVGFDPEPVLAVPVTLPRERYPEPADARALLGRAVERLAALPGVEAAGASWSLPFTGGYAGTTYVPEDAPPGTEPVQVALVPVSGDYFGAVGIPLLEGRLPDDGDQAGGPRVAAVSRAFARALWPEGDALGRRLATDDGQGITVVGVVGDVRREALDQDLQRDMYVPYAQASWAAHEAYLTVKAAPGTAPAALAPAVREAVASLDPTLPLDGITLLAREVRGSAAEPRSRTLLLVGFAAAAALLAAIGVYGVLAYRVAERRAEVALRLALGASRREVVGRVLGRAAALGGAGLALGIAAALAAAPALAAFLFQVSPLEPVVYAGVVALVAAAVGGAGWLPARRAARVDPMATLRTE